MAESLSLFLDAAEPERTYRNSPLADRLRPKTWEEFQGLEAIDKNLIAQLRSGIGKPPSLILWGPPGSGKTTLARLIGRSFALKFVEFSAVLGGVKEVREIVAAARRDVRPTLLFVDEIHRFNKGQQDAFLPHVESGLLILIGATTENPSFSLTSALLSRARVLVVQGLPAASLQKVLGRAMEELKLKLSPEAADIVVQLAGGDARRLLNFVESYVQAPGYAPDRLVSAAEIGEFLKNAGTLFYDRNGEEHYNMISAFIKSMRGSDPDAALYWGFRMLESGEDPRFLIRRMLVFASEDISNADPRALQLAVATHEAFEKLGMPEGRIPIAHCITYLATAPKSNRSYAAMNRVLEEIKDHPRAAVPLHLRNAPTKLMQSLEYGKGYEYAHDFDGAFSPEQEYLPAELVGKEFYLPSDRGYEKTIAERLNYFRSLRKQGK